MKKCRISTTDLDQLTWFRRIEAMTVEELVGRLWHKSATNEKMRVGTAWHEIMEDPPNKIEKISRSGYHFHVKCDAEVILPEIREIKATKIYLLDDIEVTLVGKVDGITGSKITDNKVTFRAPSMENYMESFQWKAYLDIFAGNIFEYVIYQGSILKNKRVNINHIQKLLLYKYPGMRKDLVAGIHDLLTFYKQHMPDKIRGD